MSLQEKLTDLATELEVPGVAAGVVHGDATEIALHGVTNVDHPLPVTADTLFQFGSTGKTLTASAVMVLVERGQLELDAPVRRYLPDLALADASVAEQVSVLQLLNHTAGWSGDVLHDTGDGDDCLARYVAFMATLAQVSPLGAQVSYNNASLSLAGHLVATVSGQTYEQAVRSLLLEPLGLHDTFGFAKEIMTRRFAVGHTRTAGVTTVATPWSLPRSGTPAGGWTATIGDQLAWARFHLGHGGADVLSAATRAAMQQPTAHMPGSALGDAVGVSWLLSTTGGATVVSHGGTTIGQHSDFALVPAADFGIAILTNSGPNGAELLGRLRTWALETYLGLVDAPPQLAQVSDAALAPYTGRYVSSAAELRLTARAGRLVAGITVTEPAVLAAGESPVQPDVVLALLADDPDRYVVPDGDGAGLRGYFTRGGDGTPEILNFSGRDFTRVG